MCNSKDAPTSFIPTSFLALPPFSLYSFIPSSLPPFLLSPLCVLLLYNCHVYLHHIAPATKVFPAVSGFSASVSLSHWELNSQGQYGSVDYGGAAIGSQLDGTKTWMESRTVVMIYRFI